MLGFLIHSSLRFWSSHTCALLANTMFPGLCWLQPPSWKMMCSVISIIKGSKTWKIKDEVRPWMFSWFQWVTLCFCVNPNFRVVVISQPLCNRLWQLWCMPSLLESGPACHQQCELLIPYQAPRWIFWFRRSSKFFTIDRFRATVRLFKTVHWYKQQWRYIAVLLTMSIRVTPYLILRSKWITICSLWDFLSPSRPNVQSGIQVPVEHRERHKIHASPVSKIKLTEPQVLESLA